jgi:hypothetical protein
MSKTKQKPHLESPSKNPHAGPKVLIHPEIILEFVELSSKEDEALSLIGRLIGTGGDLKYFGSREADAPSTVIEDYLNRKKIREHILLKQPLFNCTMDETEQTFEMRKIKKLLSVGESNE